MAGKWTMSLKEKQAAKRQAEEIAKAMAAAQPPPASSPPGNDPAGLLVKLADLRDAGVLTPDEFEAKKRELLARL